MNGFPRKKNSIASFLGFVVCLGFSVHLSAQTNCVVGGPDVTIAGCSVNDVQNTTLAFNQGSGTISSWTQLESLGVVGTCTILLPPPFPPIEVPITSALFCSGTYSDSNPSGTCPISFDRTYTVLIADDCSGGTLIASGNQKFEIFDNSGPTVTQMPSNQTFECDGGGNTSQVNAWVSSQGGSIVTDNCVITNTETASGVGGCGGGTFNYTWTYSDGCNESVSTSATYNITDTTPPMITTGASDLTVECDGNGNTTDLNNWLSSNGGAVASEICSSVSWTNDFSNLSDLCGATGAATVTFTAADGCGNMVTTSATFAINDTAPPTVNCPSDITQPADEGSTSAVVNFMASASDNCGGATVSYNQNPMTAFPSGTTMVSVTATDECSQTSNCTFSITISDNAPPTALCQDITISLDNSGNATITDSQIDNGSSDPSGVTLSISQTAFSCSNVGPNIVTLTVTDGNNNQATCQATVTVLGDIPVPAASSEVICAGETAMLMATTGGANGNFEWFSDAAGNNSVSTSNPFETPNITTTTSYYVRESTGGCQSALVQVTVSITTIPLPSSQPVAICAGETADLMAVTGGTNGSFSWFDNADGLGTPLSTQAAFTTPALTATTSYWLREEGPTCNSDLVEVVVTVNEQPADPMAESQEICFNQSAVITANSNTVNGIYYWYADNQGSQLIYLGNPYVTQPLTDDVTFYVRQILGNCMSALVPVNITVKPMLANPSTDAPITICSGEMALITATGQGGTIEWYADAAGNQLLATGETYTTAALTTSTSFWAREVDATNCVSNLTEAQVLIAPPLPDPQTFSDLICSGDSSTLMATTGGANGMFLWFSDGLGTSQVGTGASYNTGALTQNTSFWVQETDGTCFSDLVKVDVIVQANPANPNSTGAVICAGNTASLSASSGGANGTFSWYADPVGTLLVSSSNPFVTSVLNADVTYYLQESVDECKSELVPVTVTVNALPANPVADSVTICAGVDAVLTATNAGGTTEWYTDAGGNDLLGMGTPFTISGLNLSTSVWVRENNGNCVSALVKVEVIVNPLPVNPLAASVIICENTSTVLSAINTIGTITWSSMADISDTLATGNTFTTPALTATTTYYIRESALGCLSGIVPVSVTVQPLPIGLLPVNSSPACVGETVQLSAATIPNGIYNWSGPDSFTSSVQTPQITSVTEAKEGWYFVNVTVNGCTSLTDSTLVVINPAPALAAGDSISTEAKNDAYCEGETIQLVAPVVAGVTYIWTYPDGTVSSSNLPNRSIPNADEAVHQGFYTLQLQDMATGCRSEVYSLLVMVYHVPENIFATNDGPSCEGTFIQLDASNFPNATYAWSGPGGFTSTLRNPLLTNITTDNSGIYTVMITTSNGCLIQQEALTVVEVNPLPTPNAGPDQTILQDTNAQLSASGGNSFLWNTSPFLSNPGIANPVASGLPVGQTTFTVRVFNEFGCSALDSLVLTVEPQLVLDIYNLFTPNNDGTNDTWIVNYLENIGDYSLIIWDRGGYKIFETTAYANNWDGTYKGNAVPEGTYWYVIRTSDKEYKGAITLKR